MKNFIFTSNFVTAFVATFVFSACSNDKLPEFTTLDKLRVIALEIDNPEVSPGTTVTVTPWVSEVADTGTMSDTVAVCLDPGISFGATATCEGNATKVDIRINQALTVTGSNNNGSVNPFTVVVPNETIILNGKTNQERWNGINYLIDYRIKNSAGNEVRSIRRIVVSDASKTSKNTNPSFSSILADGSPMVALPIATKVNVSTNLLPSARESYQRMNSDGSLSTEPESVYVTWMVTDGKTKLARTDLDTATEYSGPSAAPIGRQAHLFAVARDSRGGVKIIKLQF